MPSPFPGMDPWLEDEEFFGDLHATIITYLREALNTILPQGYRAVSNTLVWVDDELRRDPDVSLLSPRARPPRNGEDATSLTGLVALGRALEADPWKQPYLEIHSMAGKRLVTAVEILSPSNKRTGSSGRRAYLDKQEEYRLSSVNLVEIDLLRTGTHTTLSPLTRLRRLDAEFTYHVSVMRAGTPDWLYAAPIKLSDRLPAIGIPLDHDVPAVTVDLQPLFDRAYDTGRCGDEVRYGQPPDPPLTAEQQAWAEGVLRAKGLIP